jgi:kynurenine formamidase
MSFPARIPTFAELPVVDDAPPKSAWGVFGRDDQLGSLNFLTPERRQRAARLVRRGATFNLDLPLHLPSPPLIPIRPTYRRHQFRIGTSGRDDVLDNFYLQCSSQWDGLRHVRHPQHGFYNWTSDSEVDGESDRLGIHVIAEIGICGRGVLLDVARHLDRHSDRLDPSTPRELPTSLLDEVAASQGVALQAGDIVLFRTGLAALLHREAEHPTEAIRPMETAGLPTGDATLAWLWDHQVAAIASDTLAVEVFPFKKRPSLHQEAIPLLGTLFGELFDLESLAEDCSRDGVYEFFIVGKPLHLRGGVGSPANAIAIK